MDVFLTSHDSIVIFKDFVGFRWPIHLHESIYRFPCIFMIFIEVFIGVFIYRNSEFASGLRRGAGGQVGERVWTPRTF